MQTTQISEIVNAEALSPERREILAGDFQNALPYKHIVIDNFLKGEIADELFAKFPTVQELKVHWNGLNEKKSEGSDFAAFAPVFAKVREAFRTQEFYDWVSYVTGIKEVFITDDSLGAGLHQGSDGSFLDVHIDFNIHVEKDVHRRINMLVYLQKDWKDEYGGQLEMWDADMQNCIKKVKPEFNRCVFFETNEISYHGYGTIHVPAGVTRKSFFSYFYTNEREGATKYHDTLFKARPEESASKKIKTNVKEALKNTAKSTLKNLGFKKF